VETSGEAAAAEVKVGYIAYGGYGAVEEDDQTGARQFEHVARLIELPLPATLVEDVG
jgi:hypothetical protein